MSFKLFDQGYTADEIKTMYKPTQDEWALERLRKWKESEHVLNMLRTIKASQEMWTKLEADAWLKATKRR